MGDYFVRFEQAGYAGRYADRRRKIPLLSTPLHLSEGNYIGNNASHLTDEGSSVGLEGKGNPLRLHSIPVKTRPKTDGFFASLRASDSFLLYLSPERIQKPGFEDWVKTAPISLFAIDEAHCVSQWGHDFRPDYGKLNVLRTLRPDVPILATTATATPQVLKDIAKQLALKEPSRHVYGFYRPNLYYQVEYCDDETEKMALVREALDRTPTGRIIIYAGTRKQCENLHSELSTKYPGVDYYHAGLSS